MAIIRQNSFEGGSDETVITTGNSGGVSGDAFNLVNGASNVFDTAEAAHGTMSGRIPNAGASNEYFSWSSLGSLPEAVGRIYIKRTSTPADNQRILRVFNASSVELCRLTWFTDAKVYMYDSALGVPPASSFTLTAGTFLRFEWYIFCDLTAGILETKVYDGDSTSPIGTYTRTGMNTLTNIDRVDIGNTVGSATPGGPFWIDDIAVGTGSTYLGPASTPQLFMPFGRRG